MDAKGISQLQYQRELSAIKVRYKSLFYFTQESHAPMQTITKGDYAQAERISQMGDTVLLI